MVPRFLKVILLLALTAFVVPGAAWAAAGAGGADAAEPAPDLVAGRALAPGEAADLSLWTSFSGPSLDWLVRELELYGRAAGIAVGVTHYTLGELRQRAVLGAAEGGFADVLVGVPHDQIVELREAGMLADLAAFATADYLADLPEQAVLAFRSGEGLVGLPLALEGPALIVNTSLVPHSPATYDELVDLATARNRGGNSGFMFDFGNFYFSFAWLRTHGGYVFGRDQAGALRPDDVGLATDGAILGALALRDLRWRHALLPEANDYATVDDRFATGDLAFTYNGPWTVARYFSAGVPLTVMPMPPLADGSPWVGPMSVTGVLVNGDSPARIQAANVAKWLVRSDAQLGLAREAGRIPASLAAVDALVDDEIIHGFGMALRNAEAVPNVPEMALVWQPLGAFLERLNSAHLSDDEVARLLREAADSLR